MISTGPIAAHCAVVVCDRFSSPGWRHQFAKLLTNDAAHARGCDTGYRLVLIKPTWAGSPALIENMDGTRRGPATIIKSQYQRRAVLCTPDAYMDGQRPSIAASIRRRQQPPFWVI